MRFSVIAASLFASAVMAESTIYQTEEITITSCAPTVTNCPARSTVVSTTSYPVFTSVANVTSASGVPTHAKNSTTWVPATSVAPAVSSVSLSTVYITTCVPTTTYKVVTVTPVASTLASASAGLPSGAANATGPYVSAKPSTVVTAGAGAIQGSMAVAAAAGLAAFLFA